MVHGRYIETHAVNTLTTVGIQASYPDKRRQHDIMEPGIVDIRQDG